MNYLSNYPSFFNPLQAVNTTIFVDYFHNFGLVSLASWRLLFLWNFTYISWLYQLNFCSIKDTCFSRMWIYWCMSIGQKSFEWLGVDGGGVKKEQVPMVSSRAPYWVIYHFSYALMICPPQFLQPHKFYLQMTQRF